MAKDFKPTVEALRQMTEKAKAGRLAAADEQAGASSFRDLVLGGGKALAAALELLNEVPWYISVNGTVDAWAHLTPARKRSFLAALRPLQAEVALRMRLSIARGLFKVDPESALKLIVSTLGEMHKSGNLQGRDRSAVANVLIGKTKPWLFQLDLSKLRAADAKLIAVCALEACTVASPPAAFAVIEWAKPYAAVSALNEEARSELAKVLAKWSGRWQKQIAKLDLPDDVRAQVGSAKSAQPQPAAPDPAPANPASVPPPSADPDAPAPAEPQPPASREKAAKPTNPRHAARPAPAQKTPQKPAGRENQNLVISDLLRQVEHRFEQVKGELQAARQQLRNLTPVNGSSSGGAAGAHAPELQKLREENSRLTEEIRQLRGILDELAADRFDVAVSRRADTEQPDNDPLSQYQSLLTLKLREEIMRFQSLNRENHLDGLPLLLENVINVLEAHGIDLSNIQPPPPPPKRRY
ncbi:MAG: hypothetical protein JO015_21475 [Verrucomicrobia bacterium]|nr:hypothetical protein [Verrucomicrobiota bacterium]